jgi:NMD protein affecting ribosome stability and mRNA decay
MVEVPFCSECGEELSDYFSVQLGLCDDCEIDREEDPEDELDD